LKHALRWLAIGALAFGAVCLVALEVWYRTLLPSQLPCPSDSSSSQLVRDTMWLYQCAGHGRPHLRPIFPFLLGSVLRDPHSDGALAAGVTRLLLSHDKPERQLRRALRELALATWISRHWTADEALDTYASLSWLGDSRYGMADGSAFFFRKAADDLTVAETTLLIVMMRSPRTLDPLCHPQRAREARDELIQRMFEAGVVDQLAFASARATELGTQGVCAVP
jgi:Transglycosylase